MRGLWAVLSVNGRRAAGRPGYVVMTVALSVAAIVAAILISAKLDGMGTIAYVVDNPVEARAATSVDETGAPEVLNELFRVERLNHVPPMSQLMRNRYDAVVVAKGDGQFNIVTIKGDGFRAGLEQALARTGGESGASDGSGGTTMNGEVAGNGSRPRGLGATVVGYLVMFVLMSGSAFMNFFNDDKMTGTFRRTVNSPPGIPAYLAGQLLFNGLMLFVPIMVVLVLLGQVFGVDIGFSYSQYTLLIGLLSGLATAFGFFMASLIENLDDGMAVSSSIIVVTSLLAGTFFVFEHEDVLMQTVTKMLPQRSLMVIAERFERGAALAELAGPVSYVLILSLGLVTGGWIVCAARFRAGRY